MLSYKFMSKLLAPKFQPLILVIHEQGGSDPLRRKGVKIGYLSLIPNHFRYTPPSPYEI